MNALPPDIGWDEIPDGAVIADVRWYLDGRDAGAEYAAGHVPGAVYVDLDRDLAGSGLAAAEGRHPLPDPADFAAAMDRLGVGDATPVVAYDDTGGMTAGRLVVMLRLLGHPAALADGGLAAHDGPLEHGPGAAPPAATFDGAAVAGRRVGRRRAGGGGGGGRRRPAARRPRRRSFHRRGHDDRPAPGPHPGRDERAVVVRARPGDGPLPLRPRPVRALRRARHRRADRRRGVVASCGSGVSTCANILAMNRAGLPAPRQYVAGYSGWTADPDRPVELGPSP